MEIAEFIFEKLGALFFMAILGIEVAYYFVVPLLRDVKEIRKDEEKP